MVKYLGEPYKKMAYREQKTDKGRILQFIVDT